MDSILEMLGNNDDVTATEQPPAVSYQQSPQHFQQYPQVRRGLSTSVYTHAEHSTPKAQRLGKTSY